MRSWSRVPQMARRLVGNGAGSRAMPGKRVQIDDEIWQALELLARDRRVAFQKLADEAFADLLRKHNRPTKLKAASQKAHVRKPGLGLLGRKARSPCAELS